MTPVPAGPPPAHVRRDLDVRPLLAAGTEPFTTIIDTVDDLAPGEVLALRSPFDPLPLHRVLAERGFVRDTRQLGDDDWETIYWIPAEASAEGERDEAVPSPAATSTTQAGDEVVLDVRGMSPPEPMEATLAALEELPPGGCLLQVNERVPVFLLPLLDERGCRYAIDEDERGTLVRIWPPEPAP